MVQPRIFSRSFVSLVNLVLNRTNPTIAIRPSPQLRTESFEWQTFFKLAHTENNFDIRHRGQNARRPRNARVSPGFGSKPNRVLCRGYRGPPRPPFSFCHRTMVHEAELNFTSSPPPPFHWYSDHFIIVGSYIIDFCEFHNDFIFQHSVFRKI